MERETTLPSNPQSETTRRDDETLTEFSSDSRGAEREMERERERKEATVYYSERRAKRFNESERERELSTPPPQTTSPSPLLVSPRSASPRLASSTVNHLRSPCQKSASHARRFATRITWLANGKRMIKGPDGPAEETKKTPMS